MIIQIILVGLSLGIAFYFLSNRGSYATRAYQKIALLLFIIVMISFILSPELLNQIARAVGISRGADLILYLLTLAFLFFCTTTYLKFRDQQCKIDKLARKVALLEASNSIKEKL